MPLINLAKIRIVLVETTHPGNIGASARAIKAMGLSQLYLVRPRQFPCAEATARASGADDLLVNAKVCQSLLEAIEGCGWVAATSARSRALAWPVIDPRACGTRAVEAAIQEEAALVFGREHSGLTNAELELCHAMVKIATVPQFSSLNLAAAVQIIAYEIRQAALQRTILLNELKSAPTPLATAEQMAHLYRHIEQIMTEVGFFDPTKPRRLMRRVKRLFNRAQLDHNEVNILRGFLAAVHERLGRR
jgi:tRNA (cytidine32/uridine32-2'-O)-methyltransferase